MMSDDLLYSRPSFKQSTDLVLIRLQRQRYQPIRVQVPEQRQLLSYFLEQRLIQSRARGELPKISRIGRLFSSSPCWVT